MGAPAKFHCPLCAADVNVIMRSTGYCVDCNTKSEQLARKRDALLASLRGGRS